MPHPFELPDFFRQKFEYTTLPRVRAQGLPGPGAAPDDVSDADATASIRNASKVINRITQQWFEAVEGTVRIDGDGPVVYLPNRIPIPQVHALFLGSEHDPGSDSLLDPVAYVNKGRYVERVTGTFASVGRTFSPDLFEQNGFPDEPRGVRIDGAFGWMDETHFVDTKVTAAALAGATTITLAVSPQTILRLEVRDVLLIRSGMNPDLVRNHWIEGFGVGNAVSIWPSLEFDLAVDDPVRSFGQVPTEIERACWLIMAANKPGSVVFGPGGTGPDDPVPSDVVEEKTDNYHYRTRAAVAGNVNKDRIAELSPTGSRRADIILSNYVAPAIWASV